MKSGDVTTPSVPSFKFPRHTFIVVSAPVKLYTSPALQEPDRSRLNFAFSSHGRNTGHEDE